MTGSGHGRVDPVSRALLDIARLLPKRWLIPPRYEPGTSRWFASAQGPHPHGGENGSISAEGEDELHALTDPVLKLSELGKTDREATLERRVRLAYVKGAEERSTTVVGMPLTANEQQRVFARYPGVPRR